MKKVLFILFAISCSLNVFGQSEVDDTQHSDENINTGQNLTIINLYNIDFNGEKIPINLIYSHTGIKIGGFNRSGGLGWKIQDIGFINRVVNGAADTQVGVGWFNSVTPSFSSQNSSGMVCDGCQVPGSYVGPDLSPDFFSFATINNNNFDFLYKKSSTGVLTPVIVSNEDGYKINTNFSNFNSDPTQNNTGAVFNIYDKKGNKYDFINGPNLRDYHYGHDYTTNCRNNYYLQSLTNANTTDQLNIEYYTRTFPVREQYYKMAQTSNGPGNYDYDNYIVDWSKLQEDFYEIDDSKLDLKKITTNDVIVEFVYDSGDLLIEINITNSVGDYITGYSIEYEHVDVDGLIQKIRKYNDLKTDSEVIYQFEYFKDYPDLYVPFLDNHKKCEDYLGYYNGTNKTNPFPFAIRNANNSITPAGDFEPNIDYAKQLSLKKTINRYGGVTEYEYQLNNEFQEYTTQSGYINGFVYGGGILLSSKKVTPNIGPVLYTMYNYNRLRGAVIIGAFFRNHYISAGTSGRFYSGIPTLTSIDAQADQDIPNDVFWYSMHEQGNFFRQTVETNFDFATMDFMSRVARNYFFDYEGFFHGPLPKSIIDYDEQGEKIREILYDYSYATIETVDSATRFAEIRRSNGNTYYSVGQTYRPIEINRVKKIQEKNKLYSSNGTTEKIKNTTYISAASNLMRSTTESASQGADLETKYFYATDLSDPFTTDLIAKNVVGIPLLLQTFKGTEKLSEQKTFYAKDGTTSNLLEPKYLYAKKGTDANSSLEKKLTYDSYDSRGNITQYTPENGVPVAMVWGYNKTKLIAKIENLPYSSLPSGLVTAAQNASDISNNEANIVNALIALRADSSLANSMVTTYTYTLNNSASTITDPKGDIKTYRYDHYARLSDIRDLGNNIIIENEYNFKP